MNSRPPDENLTLLTKAELLTKINNYEQEVPNLISSSQIAKCYNLLSIIYLNEENNAPQALTAIQHAIHLYPQYGTAYRTLGHIFYRTKEWKQAIEAYKTAIELDNSLRPDILMRLGLSQRGLSDGGNKSLNWYTTDNNDNRYLLCDAIMSFHEITKIKPLYPEAYLELAFTWLMLKVANDNMGDNNHSLDPRSFQDAIRNLTKGLSLIQKNDVDIYHIKISQITNAFIKYYLYLTCKYALHPSCTELHVAETKAALIKAKKESPLEVELHAFYLNLLINKNELIIDKDRIDHVIRSQADKQKISVAAKKALLIEIEYYKNENPTPFNKSPSSQTTILKKIGDASILEEKQVSQKSVFKIQPIDDTVATNMQFHSLDWEREENAELVVSAPKKAGAREGSRHIR